VMAVDIVPFDLSSLLNSSLLLAPKGEKKLLQVHSFPPSLGQ